mmetsp:Transcript_57090/g.183457  ORF Transcript_57090/g.183457 Transcript_57090/m.183457 type:complete len:527 (-) Transcript_57090:633-2213(-)
MSTVDAAAVLTGLDKVSVSLSTLPRTDSAVWSDVASSPTADADESDELRPHGCAPGSVAEELASQDQSSSGGCAAESMDVGELAPQDLYSALLGAQDARTAVLFAWWPRARAWARLDELAERCTRCLPGVRPGVDLVALPRLGEVEELWAAWAEQRGLSQWQALWFDPLVAPGAGGASTPPEAAFEEVMASLPEHLRSRKLFFYPMYLTAEMAAACRRRGLTPVGDAEDHPICRLGEAKGWLHRHIMPEKGGPSLRDALPGAGAGSGAGAARGPRGYLASTTEELLLAAGALRGELPSGARLVLKPSWASGGEGIILDVQEAQLAAFEFPPGGQHTAILEELIEGAAESPTLYMIGAEPCGALADQLLSGGGAINDGNRWPSSSASEQLTQTCVAAAQKIQEVWGLRSQWGLDFVIGRDGAPVIVDLNMGRPNGNFSVRLWESRHCQRVYLHTSSWVPPTGVGAGAFFRALRERGLAWDGAALQGVLVYQHFQGQDSAYAVASSESWEAVDGIMASLQELMDEMRL